MLRVVISNNQQLHAQWFLDTVFIISMQNYHENEWVSSLVQNSWYHSRRAIQIISVRLPLNPPPCNVLFSFLLLFVSELVECQFTVQVITRKYSIKTQRRIEFDYYCQYHDWTRYTNEIIQKASGINFKSVSHQLLAHLNWNCCTLSPLRFAYLYEFNANKITRRTFVPTTSKPRTEWSGQFELNAT